MKVIITIGHDAFLLPNDKGVSAIVTALSRAKKVRHDHSESWRGGKKDRYVEVYEDGPDVEVKTVADIVAIKIHKLAEEIEEDEPELLGLPMHVLGLPEHGTRQD